MKLLTNVAAWLGSLTPRAWLLAGMLALLAAGVFVAVTTIDHAGERTVTAARQAGAAAAVATGQAQTLDQLKDANHAEQDLRSSGERSAARFDQCLQDSRRPAACERYRPDARAQ